MTQPSQTRLNDEERANLVAYLDGEADASVARSLEEKVARSVSVRKEVEALEKTWGMLDWLPRPEAPADLASQTITRIHTQQLHAEQLEGRIKFGAAVAIKLAAWAVCAVIVFGIGFVSLRFLWRDPSRELIEDLPIVENLESYRAIPDVKFLDDLSRLGIFVDSATAPDAAGGSDAPAGEAASDADSNAR